MSPIAVGLDNRSRRIWVGTARAGLRRRDTGDGRVPQSLLSDQDRGTASTDGPRQGPSYQSPVGATT